MFSNYVNFGKVLVNYQIPGVWQKKYFCYTGQVIWQMPHRNNDSAIVPNQKFPDMKSLGDWLHAKGLNFGIYSSPDTKTCGGYLGSYLNK